MNAPIPQFVVREAEAKEDEAPPPAGNRRIVYLTLGAVAAAALAIFALTRLGGDNVETKTPDPRRPLQRCTSFRAASRRQSRFTAKRARCATSRSQRPRPACAFWKSWSTKAIPCAPASRWRGSTPPSRTRRSAPRKRASPRRNRPPCARAANMSAPNRSAIPARSRPKRSKRAAPRRSPPTRVSPPRARRCRKSTRVSAAAMCARPPPAW